MKANVYDSAALGLLTKSTHGRIMRTLNTALVTDNAVLLLLVKRPIAAVAIRFDGMMGTPGEAKRLGILLDANGGEARYKSYANFLI